MDYTTAGGEHYTSRAQIRARLDGLESEHTGKIFPPEVRDEWNELNGVLDHFAKRAERLRELGMDGRNRMAVGGSARSPEARQAADLGLRIISRFEEEL